MPSLASQSELAAAFRQVRQDLLNERTTSGHWEGELATSALSTATAVSALSIAAKAFHERSQPFDVEAWKNGNAFRYLIRGGIRWLAAHQNADGGFGDTDKSRSNIATTMLVDAAFRLAGEAEPHRPLLDKAAAYIAGQGGLAGLRRRYGHDKTFAVPILTNCALAGTAAWQDVSPLPFEMALVPRSILGAMRLPVVSYALPALIAIGLCRYYHRKPWNPLVLLARSASVSHSLRVLESIQPESGGFLEATPLTSFVVMSLAGSGRERHPVVRRGIEFLTRSVRKDGSWPIDTNLATWVTTLSINALAASGEEVHELGCLDWLLGCQHRVRHPYTNAAPGGWGWTDLSGAVPDADDTPGALLALAAWKESAEGAEDPVDPRISDAAGWGCRWLVDLQNSDGGWPTFCKGWGALPFDRSGTDLTAHAIRGLAKWLGKLVPEGPVSPLARQRFLRFDQRMSAAIERGFRYLRETQRPDGSWLPLWFGNQYHPEEENPLYGTSRVLLAYRDLLRMNTPEAQRAIAWLVSVQAADGSFGGKSAERGWNGRPALPKHASDQPVGEANGTPAKNGSAAATTVDPAAAADGTESRIEETALAVQALLAAEDHPAALAAAERGIAWLVAMVRDGGHRHASPIGFYFAKLWYYERLYPYIYTLSALGTAIERATATADAAPTESTATAATAAAL